MSTFGAFTVTRSTTKWVLNSAGVLSEVAVNTPAFEFNSDGTYRGLLVEPAATNLIIRSAEFDNASWDKTRSSVTANATTAPNGLTTADQVIEDVQTGGHHVNIPFTVADSTTVSISFFVKANTRSGCAVAIRQTDGATFKYAYFNLTTGAVTTADSGYTGTIQAYPSGWYRCSLTGSSGTGGLAARAYCFLLENATSTSVSYTGNGTSSLYVWGAQAEVGSVATSYIPTVASTANRTADSVTLTGASSLIGQTEGTLYAEVTTRLTGGSSGKRILSINDGTNDNRIEIIKATNDGITLFAVVGGVTVVNESYSSNLSGIVKIAVRYANNAYYLHVGGSLRNSDTSATVPACSVVRIGSSVSTATPFNDCVRSVALFPSSLSEAQANALTT